MSRAMRRVDFGASGWDMAPSADFAAIMAARDARASESATNGAPVEVSGLRHRVEDAEVRVEAGLVVEAGDRANALSARL